MIKKHQKRGVKTDTQDKIQKDGGQKRKPTNGHSFSSHDDSSGAPPAEHHDLHAADHDDLHPAVIDDLDDEDDEFADRREHAGADVISTDDPVRMYLMQMGRFRCSTGRKSASAKRSKDAAPLSPQHAGHGLRPARGGRALEKVRDGQLRLDRTIEVSVTNTTEKKRILKRIWPNLATLSTCSQQNNRDYRIAVSKKHPLRERRAAWRG